MTFSEYSIHHFDLAETPVHLPESGSGPRYFVFWYRSVPLGEIYLASHECGSDSIWPACLAAITPTLRHYHAKYNAKSEASSNLFEFPPADPAAIRDCCDRFVGPCLPRHRSGASVSVVICTRDRPDYLRRCLISLQRQSSAPLEIIVVDNASKTNETQNIAEQMGVRYIREERPGLDIARNTGARSARGEIVAFTDDDTLPEPYWVNRIAETFEDEMVSGMTGLVIAASLTTEAEVIFEKFWPFNRGYVDKYYDAAFFRKWLRWGPPVWKIGAGANMAFRKNVFHKIGYFDERLDVGAAGCNGDSELWYRMLAHGLCIRYNPTAVVLHQHRTSMPALRRQLHSYMRGFTVAILIQYQRFGHIGNLKHLFGRLPIHYVRLLTEGFPEYSLRHNTVFAEMGGIVSGLWYFVRHRNRDPKIYGHETV